MQAPERFCLVCSRRPALSSNGTYATESLLVNFQRKSPLLLVSEPLLQAFSYCFAPQVFCPCLAKYPLGERTGLFIVASC